MFQMGDIGLSLDREKTDVVHRKRADYKGKRIKPMLG